MSNFTFEAESKTPLETYEWDNVWFEHANNPEQLRVLYIGDSISCGTRHQATAATGEKIYFDGIGTSKAIDNPYLKASIRLYAAQQERRNAVIFNNGLHGFHLSTEEYAEHYENIVKFLLEEFAGTTVALVLSTTVKKEETAKKVIERNNAVLNIADKYNLPIIDIHTTSVARLSEIDEDGVHFSQAGYMPFANVIVKRLQELVPELNY